MKTNATILVVEDRIGEREALTRLLRLEKYHVLAAPSAEQANHYLDSSVDMVITDLRMGKATGIDLLRCWKDSRPHIPFIMVTAYDDVESAVHAMKLGAMDYMKKPVNPEELLMRVRQCLTFPRPQEATDQVNRPSVNRQNFKGMVGRSAAILDVFDNARRAAAVDSTVLITGESGTGKELIAQGIHWNSPHRCKGPFVTVNMAAVPEHLVESELFGHTRGAFTGATDAREGRFESAHGGTLFIDEIGDFALASQAKLLRVLENHKVTPVGGNHDRAVDVRVVAATRCDLEDMVREGKFREDLYYRLNVVGLRIPSLRERHEDVPLLIDYFMNVLCEELNVEPLEVSAELQEFLETFEWPGNVRQLRNCLESMIVLARSDTLTLADLPALAELGPNVGRSLQIPDGTTLHELERQAVVQALERHEGNRTHAAKALDISVRTLQRKLKAWGLEDEKVS